MASLASNPKGLCCNSPVRAYQRPQTAPTSATDASSTNGSEESYDPSGRTPCTISRPDAELSLAPGAIQNQQPFGSLGKSSRAVHSNKEYATSKIPMDPPGILVIGVDRCNSLSFLLVGIS